MRLGIDIDGVLANWNASFAQRLIAVAGHNRFPPEPYEIPVWDWPEHFGYEPQEILAAWEAVEQSTDFWLSLSPYPDTEQMLVLLASAEAQGRHDVYFISQRFKGVRAKDQTERWLRYCGYGTKPTVLISSMKGLCARALLLDAYIDDNIHNAEDAYLTAPHCRVFLQTQSWNRHYRAHPDHVTRVASPLEMLRLVEEDALEPA